MYILEIKKNYIKHKSDIIKIVVQDAEHIYDIIESFNEMNETKINNVKNLIGYVPTTFEKDYLIKVPKNLDGTNVFRVGSGFDWYDVFISSGVLVENFLEKVVDK